MREVADRLRAMVDAFTGRREKMPIAEISAYIKSLGLTSADEATKWIREDRDR